MTRCSLLVTHSFRIKPERDGLGDPVVVVGPHHRKPPREFGRRVGDHKACLRPLEQIQVIEVIAHRKGPVAGGPQLRRQPLRRGTLGNPCRKNFDPGRLSIQRGGGLDDGQRRERAPHARQRFLSPTRRHDRDQLGGGAEAFDVAVPGEGEAAVKRDASFKIRVGGVRGHIGEHVAVRDGPLHHEIEFERAQRLEGPPDFAGFQAHAAQDFSMRVVGHPGPGRKNDEIHRQPGGGDHVKGEQRAAGGDDPRDAEFAQTAQAGQNRLGDGAVGPQQGAVQVGDEDARHCAVCGCEKFASLIDGRHGGFAGLPFSDGREHGLRS